MRLNPTSVNTSQLPNVECFPDNQRIKALMIAGRVPWPTDDGWKLRTFNIIKGLSQQGLEIHLIAFGSGNATDQQYNDLRVFTNRLEVVPRNKSYAFMDLMKGLVTSMPFSVLNYFQTNFKNRIVALCKEENYDMLLVEDIVMAEYAKSIAIPVRFLDMHNIESNLLRRYAESEKNLLRKIYAYITSRKLEKYETETAQIFNGIFVCSDNDQKLLMELGVRVPVVAVSNGIDPSLFKEPPRKIEYGEIVFVGSMDYHANISGVMYFVKEIFPLILARIPDAKFSIVGKNPGDEIFSLASKNIRVTGKVDDVRPFLSQASLVIVPLIVGGGTRLKILEAMAMAKAVVSTSLGCEGINANNGETIWLEDTPESFASRVVSLLMNYEEAEIMGKKAREFVIQNYDWNNTTGKIVETYYNIQESF
jgi:polysaccharide biosynthesis protein PslH